jgi:hypothetical protein
MILVDDSLRFISSVRSDDDDARFCDSAEADFDGGLSPGDGAASFAVAWRFGGVR